MALFAQLPADLNEEIGLALSNKLNISQLNFLRLVNKTWRGAVEGGQFGSLGRLLRPGLPKLAILFRNDATSCEESELDTSVAVALPAIGIVDEATWRVHIFPLSSTGPLFVHKQTHVVLLGRSIFTFTNLKPKSIFSGFREAGTEEEWRREEASVPVRCLEAAEASCQVLAPLRELTQKGRWQLAVRNGGQPELLELPLLRKGLASRPVRGALNLKRGLLILSSEEAYLDGGEVKYVWERGAGIEWSPQNCRVVWAAEFKG
ncbi:hypothetical protein KFL_001510065 [Klebsormidium nitens]|uniref:Uncharacterized protein n=1 Tax=Klebsormidium nitens TaxID=105231 RepID=A0A1Y1HZ93_KLENI|nr:hypothetical protein KFL_001510065 [Klebsormidium nitens]|eukprot:GAQ83503.1 hypothetical protein KFL_001510065 [Klebsormidium nitens]